MVSSKQLFVAMRFVLPFLEDTSQIVIYILLKWSYDFIGDFYMLKDKIIGLF